MSERPWLALLSAVLMATAGPAAAQTVPTPPAATVPDTSQPDDIIVEGYRLRPDLDTSVQVPAAISVTRNRRFYDDSERMAKCALRSRLSDLSWLRRVVDGEFNSPRHSFAQDRLKRIYVTCGEGSLALLRLGGDASELQAATAMGGGQPMQAMNGASIDSGTAGLIPNTEPFPLGHSIYDRGAYTVQVIKRYAPDLSLTTRQTGDPQVQERFNLREGPRNRYRLPADKRYFEVAVCMVRVEPRLAVRLTMSRGEARFGDIQAALIDRARVCVGGAKNVQVDPTQFRLYIADAVYRWTLAARGVGSLIPADAARG